MITLNNNQVIRLSKIISDNIAKYIVFTNNKFYGAHCSIGSDIISPKL